MEKVIRHDGQFQVLCNGQNHYYVIPDARHSEGNWRKAFAGRCGCHDVRTRNNATVLEASVNDLLGRE